MEKRGTPELQRIFQIDERLKELNDVVGREGTIVSSLVKVEGEMDRRLTEHQKIAEMLDLMHRPSPAEMAKKDGLFRFFGKGTGTQKKVKKKKKKDLEQKELEDELKACEESLATLSEQKDSFLRSLEEIKEAKQEQRRILNEKFDIIDAIVADWDETEPIKEEMRKSERVSMRRLAVVNALRGVLDGLATARKHYIIAHSKIKKIKLLFDHPTVHIRPEGKEPEQVMREIKKELLHGELYVTRCQDTIRNIQYEDIAAVNRWLNFVLTIPLPHLVDTGRIDILLSECQEAVTAIDSADMFLQREVTNEHVELERIEGHALSLKESLISRKQVRMEYYLP
jgi:hypothetical protein